VSNNLGDFIIKNLGVVCGLYFEENCYVSCLDDLKYSFDIDPSVYVEGMGYMTERQFKDCGFTCRLTNHNYMRKEMHENYRGFYRGIDEEEIIKFLRQNSTDSLENAA